MLCNCLPGGRATMSMPLSSTSLSSTSSRSALPPPNTSVNMARKFSRIWLKVAVNISRVWVLMRLMTSSNCVLGLHQVVVLFAEELVALLGFLVFLDGHQVHRPHLVQPLLQRAPPGRPPRSSPWSPRRRPSPPASGSAPWAGPSSARVMVMHSLRTSSRLTWYFCWIRSRRFCTAMVFCASSTSRPPRCCCKLDQPAALLPQALLPGGDVQLLGLLLRHQPGRAGVDLLALVAQALDLAGGFLRSPPRPAPDARERWRSHSGAGRPVGPAPAGAVRAASAGGQTRRRAAPPWPGPPWPR